MTVYQLLPPSRQWLEQSLLCDCDERVKWEQQSPNIWWLACWNCNTLYGKIDLRGLDRAPQQ